MWQRVMSRMNYNVKVKVGSQQYKKEIFFDLTKNIKKTHANCFILI